MLKEIKIEEIQKFWPKDAPNFSGFPKYIKKFKIFNLILSLYFFPNIIIIFFSINQQLNNKKLCLLFLIL